MNSKYRVMGLKMVELKKSYPQTLLLRRAVDCRNEAKVLRAEAIRMTANTQGREDRERIAEMYEEKVEWLVNEFRKTQR